MVILILRTIYIYIWLASLILLSFFVCLIARIFCGHIVAKRLHEAVLGRGMFYMLRLVGMPAVEVTGTMPDTKERFVIVANHTSWMDHAAMSFVPGDKKFLTNGRYYKLPFFGWTQWLVEDIGVDLSSPAKRKESIAACRRVLEQGEASVMVYPEGTREHDPPHLGEFKKGAFMIAQQAKARVLPIVLLDVWKVLNRRGVCRLGRPRVVIGEPIAVGEGEAGLEQAMAEVRAWMEKQIGTV